MHVLPNDDMQFNADVHTYVAGLAGVLLQGVIAPAAIDRVEAEPSAGRAEDLTKIAVVELLQAGWGLRLTRRNHRRQVAQGL